MVKARERNDNKSHRMIIIKMKHYIFYNTNIIQ